MPPKKYTRNSSSRHSNEDKHFQGSNNNSQSGGANGNTTSPNAINTQGSSIAPGATMNNRLFDILPPKHSQLPPIPVDNEVVYFILITIIAISATGMQYLHLYRTAWWLPHSHARYAVNFYLIDKHLAGFLLTVEVIPLMLFLFKKLFSLNYQRIRFIVAVLVLVTLTTGWLMALLFYSIHMYRRASALYLPALVYPFLAYLIVYHGHEAAHGILRLCRRAGRRLRGVWAALKPRLGFVGSSRSASKTRLSSTSTSVEYPTIPGSTQSSPSHGAASINTTFSLSGTSTKTAGSTATGEGETIPGSPSLTSPESGGLLKANQSKSGTSWKQGTEQSQASRNVRSALYSKRGGGGSGTGVSSAPISSSSVTTSLVQEIPYPTTVSFLSSSPAIPLLHSCTNNPEKVREEAELLKADFNARSRDILFTTFFICFYSTVVPLLFVANSIHYDGLWCTQHVALTALSTFLACSVHYLPPVYLDLMHRCALHLGQWHREENRAAHATVAAWSELQVFPQGALVKHVRGLFRSVGINNSAEPGNSTHSRFYLLFYRPLCVINVLCFAVFVALAAQFFLLAYSYEWYKLISVTIMMFFNFAALYKLLRHRILLGRCYKEEVTGVTTTLFGGSLTKTSSTHYD